MLQGVPNKLTKELLLQQLCSCVLPTQIVTLHLPIDPRSGRSRGYAFLRLASATDVIPLYLERHGRAWPTHPNSSKVCRVVYARSEEALAEQVPPTY